MKEVERISDDEYAYQRKLVAALRAAQAAWESWAGHIATKYQIKEGDVVNEDGTIRRVE